MEFYITIRISYKDYKLKVVQIFADKVKEQYKITSKSQVIILENNRPFFRNKGLKHRRADWEIIQNESKLYRSVVNDIIEEINKVIDKQ